MSTKRTGEEVLTVVSVKAKKDGVRVYLSNGDKLVMSVDSFTEFHLYENKELTAKEQKKIQSYVDQDEAYRYAMRYLGRDLYSCMELRRKLIAKDFEPKNVDRVIGRLKDAKLLDDAHYAKVYAEDVAELRGIGHNRVMYELRVKGVSDEVLSSLTFSREKEKELATNIGEALNRRYVKTPQRKRQLKINRTLLERGFDESLAHEVASLVTTPDDPEVEMAELEKAFMLANIKYERKYEGYDLRNHIYAYLIRKGFPYEDVKHYLEEHL